MWGSFDLASLQAELDKFAAELHATEAESRRISYLWIGGGALAVLLLCGGIVWLITRGQTQRIYALKAQAEKFRDADFGEPLPVSSGDELGALARVFNDMRDKLRATTISRDYVDSILSGMNEAIIVTNAAGRIKRVNSATTHLLGYDEEELQGTSIDFLVNTERSKSLAGDSPSGLPRESIFESKYGESIPVSYTCSTISGDSEGTGDRIFAAQNITERQRAEKRIRYLARIDALTKVPNRMQFQHLLQRAHQHRSAPDHGLFLGQHEANRHERDAVTVQRDDRLAVRGRGPLADPHHARLGRAIDIGIEQPDLAPLPGQRHRKICRNGGFTHAPL